MANDATSPTLPDEPESPVRRSLYRRPLVLAVAGVALAVAGAVATVALRAADASPEPIEPTAADRQRVTALRDELVDLVVQTEDQHGVLSGDRSEPLVRSSNVADVASAWELLAADVRSIAAEVSTLPFDAARAADAARDVQGVAASVDALAACVRGTGTDFGYVVVARACPSPYEQIAERLGAASDALLDLRKTR